VLIPFWYPVRLFLLSSAPASFFPLSSVFTVIYILIIVLIVIVVAAAKKKKMDLVSVRPLIPYLSGHAMSEC
jgi:hypothetical protein